MIATRKKNVKAEKISFEVGKAVRESAATAMVTSAPSVPRSRNLEVNIPEVYTDHTYVPYSTIPDNSLDMDFVSDLGKTYILILSLLTLPFLYKFMCLLWIYVVENLLSLQSELHD